MFKRLSLLPIILAACVAGAQSPPPTVSLRLAKGPIKVGKPISAILTVKFADAFHGYQNPPTDKFQIPVTVTAGKGTKITKVVYPKGIMKKVGGDTKPSAVYEGAIDIAVTLAAPKRAGTDSVTLLLNYQQCNADSCYPPDKVVATTKLTVTK